MAGCSQPPPFPFQQQEAVMAVQARFYVAEVTQYANATMAGYAAPAPRGVVVLRPATRGEANAQWASATPSGEIKMTVNDTGGFAFFSERLGKDIAITFDDPADPVDEQA